MWIHYKWKHWIHQIACRFRSTKMASVATKAPSFFGQLHQTLKRFAYNASGFSKLGLRHDDCLYENEDVTEALRRLPQHEVDARNFRIMRALNLSLQKKQLPKDQWTKYEEDIRYLKPLLDEVVRERLEKEEWSKK